MNFWQNLKSYHYQLQNHPYFVKFNFGRQQQHGQQQQGPTLMFSVSGFTFLMSSASPPQ